MDSFKISKLTRICLENHSTVTGWQELFFLYIRRIWRSKEEREKIKRREGVGERRERELLLYRTALPSPPATFPRFLYVAPVLTI